MRKYYSDLILCTSHWLETFNQHTNLNSITFKGSSVFDNSLSDKSLFLWHIGILDNETANELARLASVTPFHGQDHSSCNDTQITRKSFFPHEPKHLVWSIISNLEYRPAKYSRMPK